MALPIGAGPGANDYTKNLQQIGGQRQLLARNEVPGDKKEQQGPSDVVDHVEIAKQHGAEAGAQTGQAQGMGKKESGVKTEGETLDGTGGPEQLPLFPDDMSEKKQQQQQIPLFMSDLYAQESGAKCGGECPGGGGTPPVQPPGGGTTGPGGPGGPVGPGGPGVPGGPGGPVGPGGPGVPGGPYAPGNSGPVAPPSGNPTDSTNQSTAANMAQMSQNDAMQANQVYWQMAMERQKHMWKIFAMMQDLQTDIMKTISEAAAKRAETMDKIAAKWAQVLGA